ncbi:MAG: hypothetical protein A3J55_03050 [Candidatus Ryanbacteria bacterium RIFCSPHIGHO2_02_FULL_45_17b]|nr:MAG: hypothetical protein A3J55_03050 [Candidatus Ryanbacteria bacterium RIFCSPHIGHO2_02_FULL_45_17b]
MVEHDKDFYSPRNVLEREEQAYQGHKTKWDEVYKGEWIAVHNGVVVAHDKEKGAVLKSLIRKQKESGRFRSYLIHIGYPLVSVRGPTTLWLGKAVRS